MDIVCVESEAQLLATLGRFHGPEWLFRGQTSHYVNTDDEICISASINRRGCIPALMRKWAFYAEAFLRHVPEYSTSEARLAVSQAILQHYGWRSFYVDVSNKPEVAAWFASHKFTHRELRRKLSLEEDEEVVLIHQRASYRSSRAEGHLYVLSKSSLRDSGVGIIELGEYIPPSIGRTRIAAQGATLLGPVPETGVPAVSVACWIIAPSCVLQEYSLSAGIREQQDLFPGRGEDPILAHFLSVPWRTTTNKTYVRALQLPEYELPSKRRLARETLLNDEFWISRIRPPNLVNAPFFRVSELLLYATGPSTLAPLVLIENLVRVHGTVVVETDGLLMHAHLVGSPKYGKGVVLTLEPSGLIEVGELVIEHPGRRLSVLAANRGYFYEPHGDRWDRVATDFDCPCNDSVRHEHNLNMVTYVADMLVAGEFEVTAPLEMTQRKMSDDREDLRLTLVCSCRPSFLLGPCSAPAVASPQLYGWRWLWQHELLLAVCQGRS